MADNCAVVGDYRDLGSQTQAFVDTETNGSWNIASEVAAGLNAGGDATAVTVSCAKPGNCTVGGVFQDNSNRHQPFVLTQTHGSWGKAALLPGLASLNQSGDASVSAISCRSVGNCSIGGSYRDKAGAVRAFVATEKNGTWTKAIAVPGLAALTANSGIKDSAILALSCASAGHCAAGGSYHDRRNHAQAFVVSEG
ncbi:MAG TPA: hypothetical protein VFI65_30270 [Streptosporangiaceae bacterium]|nr:hypothetical protein [Streptosporangiaceae bacterium]